jgi:hypothetical protein
VKIFYVFFAYEMVNSLPKCLSNIYNTCKDIGFQKSPQKEVLCEHADQEAEASRRDKSSVRGYLAASIDALSDCIMVEQRRVETTY